MSAKLSGNDLRLAIIEIAAKKHWTYETAMLREVFDLCWSQLGYRANDAEMHALLDEMSAEFFPEPEAGAAVVQARIDIAAREDVFALITRGEGHT